MVRTKTAATKIGSIVMLVVGSFSCQLLAKLSSHQCYRRYDYYRGMVNERKTKTYGEVNMSRSLLRSFVDDGGLWGPSRSAIS